MPTSDEELQAKRDRAAALREQIAAEKARTLELQQEKANEVESIALDGEIARLEQELAFAQANNRPLQAEKPVATQVGAPMVAPMPAAPASPEVKDNIQNKATSEGAGA